MPKNSILLYLLLSACLPIYTFAQHEPNNAFQQLSPEARDTIPNLTGRLSSGNPLVALELMDELIFYERDHDLIRTDFRYNLTSSDYTLILRRTLPVLISVSSDPNISMMLSEEIIFKETNSRKSIDAGYARDLLIDWMLSKVEYISEAYQVEAVAPLLSPLLDEDFRAQKRVVKLLVQLRSPLASPYLISKIEQERNNQNEIYNILKALVRINAVDGVDHIASLLDVSNSNTRYWAVWALVQLDARQFHEQIFEAVKESKETESLKPYGIAAMVKWEDQRAIELAISRLKEKDMYLRTTMADQLIEIDAKQIVPSLLAFLNDPTMVGGDKGTDSNIRANAIRVIAKLDAEKAIPTLRGFAKSNRTFLAMTAAKALGEIRATDSIPELLSLLEVHDTSGGTWYSVTEALARVGQPNTFPRLLSELKQRLPQLHHAKVLWLMSIASDPETYQKLYSMKIYDLESLNISESVNQLTEKCKTPVLLSENVEADDCKRIVCGGNEFAAMEGLLRILDTLNYSGGKYTFYIFEGKVHIVTIQEAYSFWDTFIK
ncbi:MAG: HEAT repeat domain-containing protein [Planctomycetota bacterium]|jgi:HEAT repeat protein